MSGKIFLNYSGFFTNFKIKKEELKSYIVLKLQKN